MHDLKRILLVEDDPNDVELTLMALAEFNLANEVVLARDGAEALDYLHKRGQFSGRTNGNPVVMPVEFQHFLEAIKQEGAFWALINEPPPGSVKK